MKYKNKFKSSVKKSLQVLGPGLITGASDDDPSGIATYSQAAGFHFLPVFYSPVMVNFIFFSYRKIVTIPKWLCIALFKTLLMRYFITIILFFSSFDTFSQTFGFSEGTITYKRGDSILCLVKREFHFGDIITYKQYDDADEQQVASLYIKSIRIGTKYIENITIDNKEKLATLNVSGKVLLYDYLENQMGKTVEMSEGGRMTPYKLVQHYIIKIDNKFVELSENSFEKKLSELLKECKSLTNKIDNHEFNFRNVSEIIKEYNSCKN